MLRTKKKMLRCVWGSEANDLFTASHAVLLSHLLTSCLAACVGYQCQRKKTCSVFFLRDMAHITVPSCVPHDEGQRKTFSAYFLLCEPCTLCMSSSSHGISHCRLDSIPSSFKVYGHNSVSYFLSCPSFFLSFIWGISPLAGLI